MDPTVPCVEGFWQFVDRRMEAYTLRQQRIPSPDPVLATGWYPNVKRELDRGTVYFQEQLRNDESNVIYRSIAYRLVNRRQTFETYGGIPTRDQFLEFADYLRRLRSLGGQIFTGRHQTIGLPQYLETLHYLASSYSVPLDFILSAIQEGSRAIPWARLKTWVPGVANFSAWQVVCDAMETYRLDEDLWAYMGPGPQGAYQIIHGERARQTIVLDFAKELREDSRNRHNLTLKNIEHALCEYFRYTRAWWAR